MVTTKHKKQKSSGKKPAEQGLSRWTDEIYLKVYDMKLQGTSQEKMYRALGVNKLTWQTWMRHKPLLRQIIDSSPSRSAINGTGETFSDMVWRRLPHDLQKLWDELEGIHRGPKIDGVDEVAEYPDAYERIERLFNKKGSKRARQFLFFHALVGCNFNASEACRKVNVDIATMHAWKQEPGFRALMEDELPRIMGDMAEGYVWRSAKQGEPAIIKHLMEGFIADRGYAKKRHLPDPNANGTGGVTVNIQMVLDQLPLDKRVDMLNAYRQAQAMVAPKPVVELPPVTLQPDDVEEDVDDAK